MQDSLLFQLSTCGKDILFMQDAIQHQEQKAADEKAGSYCYSEDDLGKIDSFSPFYLANMLNVFLHFRRA